MIDLVVKYDRVKMSDLNFKVLLLRSTYIIFLSYNNNDYIYRDISYFKPY